MPHPPYNIRVKHVTKAPKTANTVQIRDTFETPAYAVDLLAPFLPSNIKFTVWECAAGNGRIGNRLEKIIPNCKVLATDIRGTDYVLNHGFIHNFLSEYDLITEIGDTLHDNVIIVTNPPFSVKEEFIERAFEYRLPFAFLINADYSGTHIKWIERGCSKIVPNRRIDYITPNTIIRVNTELGTEYNDIEEIPDEILSKFTSSQAHSMWLTYGLGIEKSEVFVDLPKEWKKSRVKVNSTSDQIIEQYPY